MTQVFVATTHGLTRVSILIHAEEPPSFVLDSRAKIRRTITQTAKGVETITESDDPEVAAGIQTHVAAMHTRVKQGSGTHR